MKRDAIALLITLFFVMAVGAMIALLLHQLHQAKQSSIKEQIILQSMFIVEDIEHILRGSPQLQEILKQKSKESLFLLISQTQNLPLRLHGMQLRLLLKSARRSFNVHDLLDSKSEPIQTRVDQLKHFLITHDIADAVFVDILLDALRGTKEDQNYYSELFFDKPFMFRQGLMDYKQFVALLDYYATKYHDKRVYDFEWRELLSFSRGQNRNIDLNYATVQTWQMLLGCSKERALELVAKEGIVSSFDEFGLSESEKKALKRFPYSFFMPILTVEIAIIKDTKEYSVRFEYDAELQKAGNFEALF